MIEPRPRKHVIGPDGSPLTIADLPAPGTTRWVIRRKAEVVAAVRGGLLSLEEACQRYMLTVEERQSGHGSALKDRPTVALLTMPIAVHYSRYKTEEPREFGRTAGPSTSLRGVSHISRFLRDVGGMFTP